MNKLEEWFNEVSVQFKTDTSTFVIYRGFKITKTEDVYKIEDIKLNDFYTEVKPLDLRILKRLGFVKGTDFIVHKRDLRRINIYQFKIEKFKKNLTLYKSKLKSNKAFYTKKIKNDSENVDKFTNLLYFYKHRIIQHKNKYNLN